MVGLLNLRLIIPFKTRKLITEGIFNSTLIYCLPYFGGCNKAQVHSLQVLQNKAAQIVCQAPPRANRVKLFDKLNWLTVNQLITYHTLIKVLKIRNSSEPEYLAKYLTADNRNGRIIVPNTDLTLAMKSFSFRGSMQWNNLPRTVRNIKKVGTFKKSLRKWIILNIPRFQD